MPHFTSHVRYVVALCMFISGVSIAQEVARLKLDPERLQYAREVEQKATKAKDSLLLAEAWYLYGKLYVFAGDYRTSQDYFVKSLRIQEPRGYSDELSRLYVRMSENEGRLGRTKQALHYAKLAFRVAQKIHSDKSMIRAYGTLGNIYQGMWNGQLAGNRAPYERILSCYKSRELLCHKINDTLGVAEVSIELGTLLTHAKDPRAISYLQKALYYFTIHKKDGIRVNTMVHLASAYLTFGKPGLAFQMLDKAEKFYDARKLNEYELRLRMETQFVTYFESTGQWKKAFDRLRKLNELERIRLSADRDGSITRLNLEYETEKKEALLKAHKKELALRTQNLKNQLRFTWAASALLIMAVGMSIVFFRLSQKNKRISRRNEELLKEQNHRVKNNLQVVSSLLSLQSKRLTDEAAKKAVEESRLRVQSMAIIHRKLYDGDKFAEVNLNEFVQELVVGVLRAFGYPFVPVEFAIDNITLSADKAVPLGLILNELITNACKYAFPHNTDPFVRISCGRQGSRLELEVTDNGPGLEVPILQQGDQYAVQTKSFGMSLIHAQVVQLNGAYRFRSGDEVISTGTTFTMEFKV